MKGQPQMNTSVPDLSEDKQPPVEFVLHGTKYQASGSCPGGIIIDIAALDEDAATLSLTMSFLDAVLLPESAQEFARNMRVSVDPITLREVQKVFEHLLSEYTAGSARPTMAPSSSSDGADATGQNSKEPASSKDSTLAPVTSLKPSTLPKSSSPEESTTTMMRASSEG